MHQSTEFPGHPYTGDCHRVISEFKSAFRVPNAGHDTPSNLPTACLLPGSLPISELCNALKGKESPVFLLFEYDDDLRISTTDQIVRFVASLQPWEDYDFCAFDSNMEWCVALTHNGDVKSVTR